MTGRWAGFELGGRYGFTEQLSAYGWANHTFGDDYKSLDLRFGAQLQLVNRTKHKQKKSRVHGSFAAGQTEQRTTPENQGVSGMLIIMA